MIGISIDTDPPTPQEAAAPLVLMTPEFLR